MTEGFRNIIPESGGTACEVCGMARTLAPVKNPADPPSAKPNSWSWGLKANRRLSTTES